MPPTAEIPTLDIDPFDLSVLVDPHAFHKELRDAGPVVWLSRIGCYGMARFAEVQPALKDWETFVSSRGVGLADFAVEEPWRPPSLLLETDPPVHDRTRSLMNRIVSLSALRAIAGEWQAEAETIVAPLVGTGSFDAVPKIAEAFPLAVFPKLIGLREGGREALIAYATVAFNAFGPRNALLTESMDATREAAEWVAESCKRENLRPGGWGMQVYEAADRGECTHAEAERLVRSFLTAGVDTTVNGIATVLHAFSQFPAEWQRLRRDPGLAKKAVEEALRWGGIIQTFFRTTSREVAVAGATIPAETKVLLFLAAANRDPRKWADPDRFDIGRVASGHVGFGFGIHQCLGQMVARIEMEAVIGALLANVAEIRATGPIVRRPNNTLLAVSELPIALIPNSASKPGLGIVEPAAEGPKTGETDQRKAPST